MDLNSEFKVDGRISFWTRTATKTDRQADGFVGRTDADWLYLTTDLALAEQFMRGMGIWVTQRTLERTNRQQCSWAIVAPYYRRATLSMGLPFTSRYRTLRTAVLGRWAATLSRGLQAHSGDSRHIRDNGIHNDWYRTLEPTCLTDTGATAIVAPRLTAYCIFTPEHLACVTSILYCVYFSTCIVAMMGTWKYDHTSLHTTFSCTSLLRYLYSPPRGHMCTCSPACLALRGYLIGWVPANPADKYRSNRRSPTTLRIFTLFCTPAGSRFCMSPLTRLCSALKRASIGMGPSVCLHFARFSRGLPLHLEELRRHRPGTVHATFSA